jgi:hypothetical protein
MLKYHSFFLLLILRKKRERERRDNRHSRYRREYYCSLTPEQRRLRDKRIP